jgi:hypothetical protein
MKMQKGTSSSCPDPVPHKTLLFTGNACLPFLSRRRCGTVPGVPIDNHPGTKPKIKLD